jgi:signal transduction histidine kinase
MSSSAVTVPLASAPPETAPISVEERSLVRAFALFMDAAASLERSYTKLQAEVARLRRELEQSNRELALSLEQNRRIRQHLDRILEGLPCGVLVVEPGGQISRANPEALRLLRVPPDAPLAVPDQLSDWALDLIEQTPADSQEHEFECSQGDLDWLAIRHAQLSPEEGGSSVYILRDSSAAKGLEQAQESLGRRQALAEMSTLLAHEIRNPLGSLELFAGLLADADLGGERAEWVGHLRAGLRGLAATVNNVLQFHSQTRIEPVPTDLGQLLHSLEEFLRPLAQEARVEMKFEHTLDGIRLPADRHRLEQVLLNLAVNAFRVMPGGGTLKITGQVAESQDHKLARIEVWDSGPGIGEADLERIFDAGFTTRPGSPGLGLAVCKMLVEQHEGRITVSNQEGGGAAFRLEFPLSTEAQ